MVDEFRMPTWGDSECLEAQECEVSLAGPRTEQEKPLKREQSVLTGAICQ